MFSNLQVKNSTWRKNIVAKYYNLKKKKQQQKNITCLHTVIQVCGRRCSPICLDNNKIIGMFLAKIAAVASKLGSHESGKFSPWCYCCSRQIRLQRLLNTWIVSTSEYTVAQQTSLGWIFFFFSSVKLSIPRASIEIRLSSKWVKIQFWVYYTLKKASEKRDCDAGCVYVGNQWRMLVCRRVLTLSAFILLTLSCRESLQRT